MRPWNEAIQILVYPNSQKLVIFHESIIIYKMEASDLYFNHLYVTCFLPTNKVFMLVLMLEVLKGCNGVVDTCIILG